MSGIDWTPIGAGGGLGTPGVEYVTLTWHGRRNEVPKVQPPGVLFEKQSYDPAGLLSASYRSFETNEDQGFGAAGSVVGDVVLREEGYHYDAEGREIFRVSYERRAGETASWSQHYGALSLLPSQYAAVRSVVASWYTHSGHCPAPQLAGQPLEFLAMLIPHVCLKYEVTMRCYGAISTTFRRRFGWIQHPPVDAPPRLALASAPDIPSLDPESFRSPALTATAQVAPTGSPLSPRNVPEDPEFIRRRKRGWAKLIAKTFKDDPSCCKGCGQPMKIIAAIGPDQPDVIERILRHLHLWDPPWKRVRRARGPPARVASVLPISLERDTPRGMQRNRAIVRLALQAPGRLQPRPAG